MNVRLRPATADDAQLLFNWANDPEVRAQSFQSDPIDWDGHLAWLEARLTSTSSAVFIAYRDDNTDVGVVRFESDGAVARLSYSISAPYRGLKLAAPMVAGGVAAVWAQWDDVQVIEALVRPDNTASVRVLGQLGFQVTAEEPECIELTLRREA